MICANTALISKNVKKHKEMFIILKSVKDAAEVTELGQLAVCLNGHLLGFDDQQEAEEYWQDEDLPLSYEIVYVSEE